MALNADQIKQFDANLKREADQRAEWEEFQKWKTAKKGGLVVFVGPRNRLTLSLDSAC